MQINTEDLDAAAERAKIDNQKLYQEILNPTPGLVVDNKLDTDKKFDFKVEADKNNLSKATQKRLNKTLEQAKEKINSSYFPSSIVDNVPNNPTFTEKK